MPAAITTDRGEVLLLDSAMAAALYLRLYRNDVDVTVNSVLADFEPALFPGYADRALVGLWAPAQLDGVGRAYSRLTNVSFVRQAGGVPETSYGWLLYRDPFPDSQLVAGGRFTLPLVTTAAGQVVMVSLLAFLYRG